MVISKVYRLRYPQHPTNRFLGMDARVSPSTIAGLARAPPSKSYTHRAILAAGLCEEATVKNPLVSADTRATVRAVEAYGGNVTRHETSLKIGGCAGRPATPDDVIDCANSGTTMRLTIGTASLVDGITVLTGDDSLRDRPQGALLTAIESLSGRAESTRSNGQAPIVVEGPITGGAVSMPGDISSQYISSLLMAGGLTDEGIDIKLETALKSAPYVDITIEVLEAFGVEATATSTGFSVAGNQSYTRSDPYNVPGDFSSISYLLAGGAIAGDPRVEIAGAYPSAQGDTAIVSILEEMGAGIEWDRSSGRITIERSTLEGIEVDVADTPDLLPTIATVGAIAEGTTRIVNCEHVRYKETDRVAAMATELDRLGATVEEEHDTLTIEGTSSDLQGTTVDGYHDHRIIMALSLVGLVAEGETTIAGVEHVDVSFPNFFDVFEDLGAEIRVD